MITHNWKQKWNEVFANALSFDSTSDTCSKWERKRPDSRQNQSCVGRQRQRYINLSNGGNNQLTNPLPDIVTLIESPSQDWEITEWVNTSEVLPQILVFPGGTPVRTCSRDEIRELMCIFVIEWFGWPIMATWCTVHLQWTTAFSSPDLTTFWI